MEFLILEGNRALSPYNVVYEIAGIELITERRERTFYDVNSKFFQTAAVPGTRSKGYIMNNDKVMLL